jgi:pantoate--beta-alanine ligase
LRSIATAARSGVRDAATLTTIGALAIDEDPLARLEYLELVHPDTFDPVDGTLPQHGALAVVAAWLGDVRLIDNLLVP